MAERLSTYETIDAVREPLELLPDFYLVNGENVHRTEASGFVLNTEDMSIVIDRGSGARSHIVDPMIERLAGGRNVIDIGTHDHYDHTGGVNGRELWLPGGELTVMPTGDSQAADLYDSRPHRNRVTRLLQDHEVLQFGSTRMTVNWTPGHAPAHASYFIENKELSLIVLGDLDGGHSERIGSDMTEREKSVAKLRELPFTHFVKGHTPINASLLTRKKFDLLFEGMGKVFRPCFQYLENPLLHSKTIYQMAD